MEWPGGKSFAFTVFDDTDLQTIENVSPVYTFLAELGYRTTKSVWPIRGAGVPKVGGVTCEEREYLEWVKKLQGQGFEIALHNVTYHTSVRQDTMRGLEHFRQLFGHYPWSMANHTGCDESIYWGNARLTGVRRLLYDLLHASKSHQAFEGHVEGSPLFWGDICKRTIKYVRNFTFGDINTLKVCPVMPYHDPERPYVNHWFAASEGPSVQSFNEMLKEGNQDRLLQEGGACIMYSHFACGFSENGRLNPRFRYLMERLSKMNGWFVPVQAILDFILQVRGAHTVTSRERAALEKRWLWHKLLHTRGRS